MAIKIMVSVQKGGTGKTTTTAVLAEVLAEAGSKVLVMDLDSQGNATQMLTQRNIYEFSGNTILEAIKEADPKKYIVQTKENLAVLPAEDMLSTFSRYIYRSKYPNPMTVLKDAMADVEDDYDIILLDCPPNLGDLVLNAIIYADYVIIPVQLDAFGIDALDRYVQFVEEAKNEGHTQAEILGILFTMVDNRVVSEKVIADSIRRSYGGQVFRSEIKKRAKMREFALMGVSMKRKSELDALLEYQNLAEEVIERVQESEQSKQAAGQD